MDKQEVPSKAQGGQQKERPEENCCKDLLKQSIKGAMRWHSLGLEETFQAMAHEGGYSMLHLPFQQRIVCTHTLGRSGC